MHMHVHVYMHMRRYEYRNGKAIVYGSHFLHGTEPGHSREAGGDHAAELVRYLDAWHGGGSSAHGVRQSVSRITFLAGHTPNSVKQRVQHGCC